MRIKEIVQSEKWKVFMGYVNGWGGTIVIIGALFKLQHYPGASLFIVLGFSVEALIFFFSAFEPPHHEVDWSVVYPELAGLEPNSMRMSPDKKGLNVVANEGSSGGTMPNFGETNISQDSVKALEKSFQNLEKTSSAIENLAEVSSTMDTYVENLQDASKSLNLFNESSKALNDSANSFSEIINISASGFAEGIDKSTKEIANSVKETSEILTQSNTSILASYQDLSGAVNEGTEKIKTNHSIHAQGLDEVNKNLSALNATYELEISEANKHIKTSGKLLSETEKLLNNLVSAADNSVMYKEETQKLTEKITALNDIYGNMLNDLSN